MTPLIIEPYSDKYKQDVIDLILHIQTNEFGIPINLNGQPDLNGIPSFYQINHGNFWLAIADKKVVGTIGLLDIGNGQAALRKMFVHESHRGKEFGVGQQLLNRLIDWARSKKYAAIFLGTTAKFIGAQKFYEKNNFIDVSKEQLPANFPVMEVDVKFYRLGLK